MVILAVLVKARGEERDIPAIRAARDTGQNLGDLLLGQQFRNGLCLRHGFVLFPRRILLVPI